jgi:protein-S-isoprenylcysteine O-methyltransferase Ste14
MLNTAEKIISAGVLGFLFLLIYDLVSLIKLSNRFLFSLLGYSVQAYAVVRAACYDRRLMLGSSLRCLAWPLMLSGLGWLLYCLFLYQPLRKTYFDRQGPVLTTEGPYALVRHPGVYGYTVFILALAVVCRSRLLLSAGSLWSLINIIYVFIQDRFIFPVLLVGYDEYRRHTPMLIPTAKSFRRFWATK